jgi:hypothetical protein
VGKGALRCVAAYESGCAFTDLAAHLVLPLALPERNLPGSPARRLSHAIRLTFPKVGLRANQAYLMPDN